MDVEVKQKTHLVFVYGTLKKSFPNSHLLKDAEYVGEYVTLDQYPLVVGGPWFSPYLLNVCGAGERVFGEVYKVSDHELEDLDQLENVGVNYTRKLLKVEFVESPGRIMEVFAYLKCNYNDDLLKKDYMAKYNDDDIFRARNEQHIWLKRQI
eukprot:CAMPEP_0182448244 /NCGR_PEP_ID=MMETSP1172-20130603/25296_1 /TAXON_ID=708627 /ORGANISM="Timspurckia oligopyrenoides, Strain CCMP3278" /LENGTH=151 /DNA_ID=CAMNT_0024645039 /DNA_START=146 /DNA_END=602 /DNA_ORIENTATION=-